MSHLHGPSIQRRSSANYTLGGVAHTHTRTHTSANGAESGLASLAESSTTYIIISSIINKLLLDKLLLFPPSWLEPVDLKLHTFYWRHSRPGDRTSGCKIPSGSQARHIDARNVAVASRPMDNQAAGA